MCVHRGCVCVSLTMSGVCGSVRVGRVSWLRLVNPVVEYLGAAPERLRAYFLMPLSPQIFMKSLKKYFLIIAF